jgi:hypothetical protein
VPGAVIGIEHEVCRTIIDDKIIIVDPQTDIVLEMKGNDSYD